MPKNKILVAALALLILVSLALVVANVSAGDDTGGLGDLIRALL